MTPERWQRINEIYHSALERPIEQRGAFLAEVCSEDTELRREVETLLASSAQQTLFIDGSALNGVFQALAESDLPGPEQRIGPYRLLREIGEGGMGVVYLAARADDEYQKQVAIKLVRRGMDNRAALERFLSERQILAGFDHPNIARLFDGGTTENGLPYLVMEYIDGQPIDEYCDGHRLSISDRLKLFREVCSAVQYAHQHLVIHRDIKPSNILVTADGVPKLLDFGIAKLLDPTTGDHPAATATIMRMMTPEYASPEQVRGEQITTASDTYSLGVVLYELLSGHAPYRFKSRSPIEVAQVIFDSEPERLSTMVLRTVEIEVENSAIKKITPELVSQTREGSPDRLSRKLRGDLDNIVLMAMRKEKERRYASVDQLSHDIRRHLEGRPIIAHKDTLSYRTSKFVRRNRVAVAAATLVFFTLIGGIIATAWQARVASKQRLLAVESQARAERRFNDVRKIANSVLFGYHDEISTLPGTTAVRERMAKDMLEYLNSLAQEASGDAPLQRELAGAYEKVSDVQSSLGDTAGAIESRRKGIEIRESLLRADPDNADLRAGVAFRYRELGNLFAQTTDATGALQIYEKAISIAEPLLTQDPASEKYRRLLAYCYSDLGSFQGWQGDYRTSLDNGRKAQALYQSLLKSDPKNEWDRYSLAACYEGIAQALLYEGDPTGALDTQLKVVELREALTAEQPLSTEYKVALGLGHYYVAVIQWHFAKLFGQKNYLSPSLDNYRKSEAIAEELIAADPKNVTFRSAIALIGIGDVLDEMGKTSEAAASYQKALTMREEVAGMDPANVRKKWWLVEACGKTAKQLAKAGNRTNALDHCRKTIGLIESAGEPADADLLTAKASALNDVAEAFSAIAAEKKRSNTERAQELQMARHWYTQTLEIMLALKNKGTFGIAEQTAMEDVKRAIAKSGAALAGLDKK